LIHLGKDIVHLGEKIQDEEEVIDDIVVKDINKVEEVVVDSIDNAEETVLNDVEQKIFD